MANLIGVDVGTSAAKVVMCDLAGRVVARAEHSYGVRAPRPGWVEQDPDEVWRGVLKGLRSVMAQAGGGARPLALALACQSGSVTLAAEDGTPLAPNITWMDGRTEALVRDWQAAGVGERVRAISGWQLHPGLALPTLAWLNRHEPALMARAARCLTMSDDLTHRLTGEWRANPSNGGGMQLLDIRTGQWSAELCALAGIRLSQLAPVQPGGAVIGRVRQEVRAATGLPEDAVVVNGGHDQGCAALGMGVTSPGKVLLACGTSWVVTDVAAAPDPSRIPGAMDLNFHAEPGCWTASQSLGGLGAVLDWWLAQAWPGGGSDSSDSDSRAARYAALEADLADWREREDAPWFLPTTGGHVSPAGEARGGFVGLRLDHRRADLGRAVMEGAAFELRWALEEARAAGLAVDRLWMMGGATRSTYWPRVTADVVGLPLEVSAEADWPCLGAAILAASGAGLRDGFEAGLARAGRRMVAVAPQASAVIERRYCRYRQAAQAVTTRSSG